MIGRLLCRLGKHRRSRRRLRQTADGWMSRCSRCAVPLRRTPDGAWIAVMDGD